MKKGCFIIVGIVVVLMVIGITYKPSEATKQKWAKATNPQEIEKEASKESQVTSEPQSPAKAGSQWTYSTDEDAMGRKQTFAILTSANTLEFGFPYQGRQHGTLIIRKSTEWGTNVLLKIERGQFICGFDDCVVNVRFDSGPIQHISASAPQDHSTTTLFLESEAKLVSLARKAKIARFEATFYHEGSQTLEFNVEGFEWK